VAWKPGGLDVAMVSAEPCNSHCCDSAGEDLQAIPGSMQHVLLVAVACAGLHLTVLCRAVPCCAVLCCAAHL
jgi:hypothetical protein